MPGVDRKRIHTRRPDLARLLETRTIDRHPRPAGNSNPNLFAQGNGLIVFDPESASPRERYFDDQPR